jgi:hypothetical protein
MEPQPRTHWLLTQRPGWLRLRPTQASGFWTAHNTLTQKGQGPWSRGEVKFDLQNLKSGDICGLGTLGKYSAHIAVNCDSGQNLFLSMNVLEDTTTGIQTDTRVTSVPIQSDMIMLRTDLDFQTNQGLCSYSIDGTDWTSLGGAFPLAFDWQTGTFQGEKFAIFCYNPNSSDGYVDVDFFTFSDTLPPIPPRSAYSRIEAEDYDIQSGTDTETCSEGGQNVGWIENGDYLVYENIDFGGRAVSVDARVASATSGGSMELYLDSLTGTKIGTCAVQNTGGWQTWGSQSCPVSDATGIHDLYLKFTGGGGYLFNVNWWQFVRYGDMNRDNIVNTDDFLEFAGHWLRDDSGMDLNADGMINLYEFAEFATNWLDDSFQ